MADENTGNEFKHRRTLEYAAATFVGLFSGLFGVAARTRLQFHKKLINYIEKDDQAFAGKLASVGGNRDALDRATRLKAEIREERLKHGPTLDGIADDLLNRKISTDSFIEKSRLQKNSFSDSLNKFSKEGMGIESEGIAGMFKGTWQRFNYLGKDTRLPILIDAAIAMTVGMAGTKMFFNSLNTHTRLDQLVTNQRKENAANDNSEEHPAPRKMRHSLEMRPNEPLKPSTKVEAVEKSERAMPERTPEQEETIAER